VLLSILILGFLCGLPQPAQEPKIEQKPVSIPAGAGQRPFDVSRHLISLNEIQFGGPPRNGIPALDHPAFTSSTEASQVLRLSDLVLGIATKEAAKAYPVRILNWHEVINDDVGRQPVVVSWCPLCGSGVAYNPHVGEKRYTFGVSGLLYKRNLLLYDHETDSLWSQLGGKAVTGVLAGTSLDLLPVTLTTWARWRAEHPETSVLSFQTGYRRDYSTDPYRDWPLDRRLAFVVVYQGTAKIYPYSELKKTGLFFKDDLAGHEFTITFDPKNQTATIRGPEAGQPPHFVAFLADARAFFPDAQVFKSK
jgi:hypothetical protein